MQKEHMLLQPRMMERYVLILPAGLTGKMSAYVSSVLSCTFIAPSCFRPLVLVRPCRLVSSCVQHNGISLTMHNDDDERGRSLASILPLTSR